MSRADAKPDGDAGGASVTAQRLDKWLWFARLAKTRTQAAALVTGGRIRVNRERVDKPGTTIKAGDVVTATVHRNVRVLKVAGFLERRGPVAEASLIFEELTPAADRTKAHGHGSPGSPSAAPDRSSGFERAGNHAERLPGSGRPTKRDRREIDRLKDHSS